MYLFEIDTTVDEKFNRYSGRENVKEWIVGLLILFFLYKTEILNRF